MTANVATYDRAYAGSFQLNALVSENVALNAGVATGFNKGGKTADRVVLTFGFQAKYSSTEGGGSFGCSPSLV
jgi:trimeric autotransporter adhesin